MSQLTQLQCHCGKTRLELSGKPFLITECLCNSCRKAATYLQQQHQAPNFVTPLGATACAEYRKDRVKLSHGENYLTEFKLSADAGTRRILASCCNTPLFMELKGAHWLSIYLSLWPAHNRPQPQLRTMAADWPADSPLPEDIPNLHRHSLFFYAKLFCAWVAMGFKNPGIRVHTRLACPDAPRQREQPAKGA